MNPEKENTELEPVTSEETEMVPAESIETTVTEVQATAAPGEVNSDDGTMEDIEDEDQENTNALNLQTEDDFQKEVDRLRAIAETPQRAQRSTGIRPGRFRAKQSSAAKPTLPPETMEMNTQRVQIFQSYAKKTVLMGRVVSIEREFRRDDGSENGGRMRYYVIVMYGKYQVYIPAEEFVETPMEEIWAIRRKNHEELTLEQSTERFLTARMHAIIPFVVTKALPDSDTENRLKVGGSRIEAMKRLRIKYWYGKTMDGKSYYINAGDKIPAPEKADDSMSGGTNYGIYQRCARIVAVTKGGIRVELFGAESFIPVRDITWNRMKNVRDLEECQVGYPIDVMITNVTRQTDAPTLDECGVTFTASVKEAHGDPRRKYISMFATGSIESGVVSYVKLPDAENPDVTPRIFVSLDKANHEMQCMCNFPTAPAGESIVLPKIGTRAIIRISQVNTEKAYLHGAVISLGN